MTAAALLAALALAAPDRTTVTVANSPGYSFRADGSVAADVKNGTGGSITKVTFSASTPAGFAWTGGAMSPALSGWTVTVAAGQLVFQEGATKNLFANGTTVRFTGRSGTAYPNVGAQTTYAIPVGWSGAATGSASASFVVTLPIADLTLPAVARSASLAGARFYWTYSDVNQTHAGAIVVRGSDRPVDRTTYAAGAALGASRVLCVDAAGTATGCTEASGFVDDTAASYVLYEYDAQHVYSAGKTIACPARPLAGFLYKHEAFGLTPPGIQPGTGGFVVFGANDRGLYFVSSDGSEHRRAFLADAGFNRRSTPLPFSSGSSYVVTADMGASPSYISQGYVIDPSTSSATPFYKTSLGATVTSGVAAILKAYYPGIYTSYNGDVIAHGTNLVSGNYVRAYSSTLGTAWTFNTGADAVTHELNVDYAHGAIFAPVGAGGGGVYGFDVTTAYSVTGGAPKPAGWPAQKILAGNLFKAQCRVTNGGAVMYCGSDAGVIFAVNPATGATLTQTTVTGSVQSIFAVNNVGLYYTTRSGKIGRVDFAGATFTPKWEAAIAGATVVSPAQVAAGFVYVGANGQLHKLSQADGTVAGTPVTLDGGAQVSEPGMDFGLDMLFAETAAGTIWGLPRF